MPWCAALLCGIACPSALHAQVNGTPPANPAPLALIPDPASMTLPYQAMARHGAPLLQVTLEGKPDHWFLADTGTANTWLSATVAARDHVKTVPYDVPGADKSMATTGTSVNFQLGSLSFPAYLLIDTGWMHALCDQTDSAESLEGSPRRLSGILGMNLLKSYAVELDPDRQELRLTAGALSDSYLKRRGFPGGTASAIPITLDDSTGLATVTASISEGKEGQPAPTSLPIPLIIDTGSYQTQVTAQFDSQFQGTPLPRKSGFAASGSAPVDTHTNCTIRIGNITRTHIACGISHTAPASDDNVCTLGMDFLSHYRVLIDLPNHHLYLEPLTNSAVDNNASARENATKLIDGLLIQPTAAGAWGIRALRPESHFARSGIQLTDQIVAVDDIPLAGRDPLEVASLLGRSRTVTVQREGKPMTLSIK